MGVENFRLNVLNDESNDLYIGSWYTWIMKFVIPVEAISMLVWWFYQAVTWSPNSWWKPLNEFSLGTVLIQWAGLILVLVLINSIIYRWIKVDQSYA
jgi:NSS family neurotransmitter:Na+ symporter